MMKWNKLFLIALMIIVSPDGLSLAIYGNDVVDIYPGPASLWVGANDGSTLNIYGSQVVDVYANDQSNVNIFGGSVGYLYARDESKISVTGGEIGWLYTYQNSEVVINNPLGISWLLVNGDSRVDVFVREYSYERGILSGLTVNGTLFSIIALEEDDLIGGNNIMRDVIPENIVVHAVPVPSSIVLFMSAIAGCIAHKRRRIKGV